MPFLSESASAIKSRFGFHDHSVESVPSVRSSPDLHKSASKDSLAEWEGDDGVRSDGSGSQSLEFREDPSFWKDHNVQVIIRLRPLSSSEISLQGYSKCVRQESCQTITWTGHPESRFTFDIVADETVSQEKLFKVAGFPMVDNCMGGYNSCMFAYGQTGSGKTHTMLGDIEGGTRRHSVDCGMTPRVFEHLFSRIQKEKEARRDEKLRFTCKCSFLEIYNEQILDLLEPSSNNLQIREDIKKGVYVENLKEIEVTSARDVIQQLIQGAANRKVAATNMNRASSRSHSVFTCIIESKWESQGVTHHRFSRLNLVDLAGSERQKSSGAEGERLKEATNINKSLSTLGLVIMNLVNISNGKSMHVPYRDSKLTFLLQDSLGGNSKTIIIANISPANCCSLETLSTLKFAQRAKFIKNNAIVNEDASGDVIAMRIQIQQLKKELSRLRGQDNDTNALNVLGSPGSFKFDGLHESFSPLTSVKRMSQRKDYEVALIGAFRREKDKDIALQALTAENQAAVRLAKQREDEIRCLNMRLRFREAGIKRLEAVASGKITAETHLLKEKEEQLKEIEVLRNQLDRNQEVTRFAMENLRLKEEIRRLKSFYEEGEREMMNEQIMVLQKKLLEALDWKLMHESELSVVQKSNSDALTEDHGDGDMLNSNHEPRSSWRSTINEENEFLRMQAIHNQAEMDALQKNLDFCLVEKENLERHVNDLVTKLEEERSSRVMKEEIKQIEVPSLSSNTPIINFNDQMELKTMVDAIAAASQREAEAHETAIVLSKENDELRVKLKVLIEDNNKLIELYEQAAAESNYKTVNEAENAQENGIAISNKGGSVDLTERKETEMKNVVESLEHQLVEMHEENDKLLGLYEKAMQERDEFKRMLSSGGQNRMRIKAEYICPEKLVEVDGGEHLESGKPPIFVGAKDLMEETGPSGLNVPDGSESPELEKPTTSTKLNISTDDIAFSAINVQDESPQAMEENQIDPRVNDCVESEESPRCIDAEFTELSAEERVESVNPVATDEEIMSIEAALSRLNLEDGSSICPEDHQAHSINQSDVGASSTVTVAKASEDLSLVRKKLDNAQEKLLDSVKTVTIFGSLEKSIHEFDKVSREIEAMEDGIRVKQQFHESLKLLSSDMQKKRCLLDNKFSALKYSLSSFSSSVVYFEQREARARARVNASMSCLNQKKHDLGRAQSCKDEIEAAQRKIQQSEVELRNNLSLLRSKHEEVNRKQDNEKVLFAIDNVEKTDPSLRNWHLGGKATELLKSEEEKTKLQTEIKMSREKLGLAKCELEDLNKKVGKAEIEIQAAQMEMQKALRSVEEMETALQGVLKEKEMLLEIRENGKTEIQTLITEFLQCVFEAELKEAELQILEAELDMELRRIRELQTARAAVAEKKTKLLDEATKDSCLLAEKMEEELRCVGASFLEVRSLLDNI